MSAIRYINIETLFTHVDADIDSRHRVIGHDLALHAGLAPLHLFRPNAKDEWTRLPHGARSPRIATAPPVRSPGGGRPLAIAPFMQQNRADTTCKDSEACSGTELVELGWG